MSTELEEKVASLTTAKATLESENNQIMAKFEAEQKSRQEAEEVAKKATDTIEANQKRIDAIVVLSEKYDKDGDLKASALQAIQGDKSADEFKDEVLEVIAKRPTSQRIEGGEQDYSESSDLDALRAQVKEESDPVEKAKLAQRIRELRNK